MDVDVDAIDETAADVDLEYTSEALCAGMTLTSDAVIGKPAGTPIHLVVSGTTCGVGDNAEYQFLYQPKSETPPAFVELRSYSTDANATWDTTGLTPGRYNVKVFARAVGTTTRTSVTKEIQIGHTCTSTSLSVAPAAPRRPGTTVALAASSSCSGGTPEYRFSVRPYGVSAYTVVRDWASGYKHNWNSTGFAADLYTIQIETRVAGNLSINESNATAWYDLGESCTIDYFTPDVANNIPLDETLTLSALATCTGTAKPWYRLQYLEEGTTTWVTYEDFSSGFDGEYQAILDGMSQKRYTFLLSVQPDDHPNHRDVASATIKYDFGDACRAVLLTTSASSPSPVGTAVTLTASATCNAGTVVPEYRFLTRAPDQTADIELRGWSTQPTALWSTGGLADGFHQLVVETRAQGAPSAHATSRLQFGLGSVCTSLKATISPISALRTGKPFTVTAGAQTCASPEYRFSSHALGKPWTVFRDWGAAATASHPNTSADAEQVRVEVRRAGRTQIEDTVFVGAIVLPVGELRSLQAYSNTTRSIRDNAGFADTLAVNASSSAAVRQSATFRVVAGLADASCYSFESRNSAGSYLRNLSYRLRMAPRDGSVAFDQDATFCARTAISGAGIGISLTPLKQPTYFVRHRNSETRINPYQDLDLIRNEASWLLAAPWAP